MNVTEEKAKPVPLDKYLIRISYVAVIVLFLLLVFILKTAAVFIENQNRDNAAHMLDIFIRQNRAIFLEKDFDRLEREMYQITSHHAVIGLEISDNNGRTVITHEKKIPPDRGILIKLPPVITVEKKIHQDGSYMGKFLLKISTDQTAAGFQDFSLILLGVFILSAITFFLFMRRFNKHMRTQLHLLTQSISNKGEVEALKTQQFSIEELVLIQRKMKDDSKDLRSLKEELKRQENMALIGNFASSIVHDIRNPLSVINGYTELLQTHITGKEQKYTEKIFLGTLMIQRLLEDILTFVREKDLELKITPQKPEMVVHRAEEFLEPLIERKGVRIVHELVGGHSVNCDIERLSRAIMNLIKNSLEASKPGDTLTVKSYKEKDMFAFSVGDNGPGIPEGIRDTIFQPFATANKSKGTGLGLFIVKTIVEAHQGNITFDTGPFGTTFYIKIPA